MSSARDCAQVRFILNSGVYQRFYTGVNTYFWASQGHQLYVAEDAIVGNIGTRTKAPQGQQEDDLVSKGAPNKILTRKAMSNVLNSLEQVFIEHVAIGRGVTAEDVRERFGQGSVFVGAEAVNAGLADYTGTLDEILGGDFASTRPIKSVDTNGKHMNTENTTQAAADNSSEVWNNYRKEVDTENIEEAELDSNVTLYETEPESSIKDLDTDDDGDGSACVWDQYVA